MCERSGSFVGVANDPVWGADARGWWGRHLVLAFVFGSVFVVIAGPWAQSLCPLLALSVLLVLSALLSLWVLSWVLLLLWWWWWSLWSLWSLLLWASASAVVVVVVEAMVTDVTCHV